MWGLILISRTAPESIDQMASRKEPNLVSKGWLFELASPSYGLSKDPAPWQGAGEMGLQLVG